MRRKHDRQRNMSASALLMGLAAWVATVPAVPGHAYAADKAALERQFNDAFTAMLNDPSDVALTMRYAELAVDLGDYESAIPPLERLLMANPNLLDVRLEVGVMYFMLNSHAMAKEYLLGVKNNNKATSEQIKRAEEFLARM